MAKMTIDDHAIHNQFIFNQILDGMVAISNLFVEKLRRL